MKTKVSFVAACRIPLLTHIRTCIIVSDDTASGRARRKRLITSSTVTQLCARTLLLLLDTSSVDRLDAWKRVAIACLVEDDGNVLVLQDSVRPPVRIVPYLANCLSDVNRFMSSRDDWDVITLASLGRMSPMRGHLVIRIHPPILFSHALVFHRKTIHALISDSSLPLDAPLDVFLSANDFSVFGHYFPILLRQMDRRIPNTNPLFRRILSHRNGWNMMYALNRNPTLVSACGLCGMAYVSILLVESVGHCRTKG